MSTRFRLPPRLVLVLLPALALLFLGGPPPAYGSTFTVNSTGDGADSNTGDDACNDGSGNCTLRAAIQQANATGGLDAVEFGIGTGVQTIAPASELPAITDPVTIDGTTQPECDNYPCIQLNGSGAGAGANGLTLMGSGATVRGLVLNRFDGSGIYLGSSGEGNTIEENYIGSSVDGGSDLGNGTGVSISYSNDVSVRDNLISGNSSSGVNIYATSGTAVTGNLIGVNWSGSVAIGNGEAGVMVGVDGSVNNVTIGGASAGERNVISGNGTAGVHCYMGYGPVLVRGNYIGLDVTGMSALPNAGAGVATDYACETSVTSNVISGNTGNGVEILRTTGGSVSGNTVEANLIGTNASGTAAVPNGGHGVLMSSPAGSLTDNRVGGGTSQRNVISGNSGSGVALEGSGTTGNDIQGNYIGLNAAGTAAVPNGESGIKLSAPSNMAGGQQAGRGNVISGNGGYGVSVWSDGNVVAGNRIGTNAAGTAALPNNMVGVFVLAGTGNTIGGTTTAARNVISGHDYGVALYTADNVVAGNYIGTNAAGTEPLGNTIGVVISGPSGNTIGGTEAGAGNVISGNTAAGVRITGVAASGNVVEGNRIGTDAGGAEPLGNGSHGVWVENAGANTIGGAAEDAGNTIAYNGGDGVAIVLSGGGSHEKAILGNAIHDNGGLGIDLDDDGVTGNDPGDGDDGANGWQNFPVLADAETDHENYFIGSVSLNSAPNKTFRIEFFATLSCDPSEFGEGETFIGFTTAMTDGSGNIAPFSVSLGVGTWEGWYLSATATDPDNNTSEFSRCVEALWTSNTPAPETATQTPTPTVTGPTPTGATPTPTLTPTPTGTPGALTGDTDCDEDVDSVDALMVLRETAGLPHSAACIVMGDADCDSDRDSVDALRILRHVAALANPQWGCPGGGTPLPTATASPTPVATPTGTPHPGSVDQRLTGDPACASAALRSTVSSSGSLLQEFVPGMPTLLGVDLCISASAGKAVQLNIRDGTATAPGAILASASGTTDWDGSDGYLHLDLAAPLAVTPGHMLVLEIPVSNDFAWRGTCAVITGVCATIDADLYPPGQASYHVGDFGFRTYGGSP